MKAVLFDFNGTLYDDNRLHIAAWQNFFKQRYGRDLSAEEIQRRCIGPSNADIFAEFLGDIPAEEARRLSAEKEADYRVVARSDPNNLHLVEGAPEMFDRLTQLGIPFALATSSPLENVQFYLEDLGMKRWLSLDRIVYDEGKLASKPDPAFYIEAARRLGVTPEECAIVEDSLTGIRAAINAHAGKIIAIDRSVSRDRLESIPEIDAIIHDFQGFERLVR